MKSFLVLCLSLTLIACGPSREEVKRAEMEQQRIEQEAAEQLAAENATRVAAVTCAVMSETGNMDAAIRVREMNAAREKIGGEPFLRGDNAILEAFEYGLCEELVLNVPNYEESLGYAKGVKREQERIAAEKRAEEERIAAEKRALAAAKRAEEERIAAEKRAEEERIAAEKLAEEERIAAEKQRIADAKPTVEEKFHPNGKLKKRINYQSKNDGGKRHGVTKSWYDSGQLLGEETFADGLKQGLERVWHENGQLMSITNYKDDKRHGVTRMWHKNGQVWAEENYEDGEEHGVSRSWYDNGNLQSVTPYRYGKFHGVSERWNEYGRKETKLCFLNGNNAPISKCKF